MEQLNTITQQSASSSEELAATAEEMSGQAEQLQQLMSFFKVEMDAEFSKVMAKKPASSSQISEPKSQQIAKVINDEQEFVKF